MYKECARRIIKCRKEILNEYPFFGRLLLRLNIAFAECGSAYTDASQIVFDTAFVSRLADNELKFLLLHELLHVVLKHCFRAFNRHMNLYNIACDIVVNSCILDLMDIAAFTLDGKEVFHVAPDGSEGREHSAERVYEMLLHECPSYYRKEHRQASFDCHEAWSSTNNTPSIKNAWKSYLKEALLSESAPTSTDWLARVISDVNHSGQIDWKIVLRNFLQYNKTDFFFEKPDMRYDGDFILPGLYECTDNAETNNIWILLDTSASIDSLGICVALSEIHSALEQLELKGQLSCFDDRITTPIPFENAEDIKKIPIVGGGGTSFHNIFKSVNAFFSSPPDAIIILTDGYAEFPRETEIPTIWIMINSPQKAPWGQTITITTD